MPYVNVELELYALVEYLEKRFNTTEDARLATVDFEEKNYFSALETGYKDALDKLKLIVDRI